MATKARPKAKTAPRAEMIEKEPTQLHQDFADWLEEETGYKPDLKSVQLATVLRMDFQRSERNQARLTASKAEREKAEAEREKRRQERATAKKAPAKTATKTAAKKTAAKKSTAAPAKKAAAPARRRAAKKTAATDESFE